MNTLIKNSIINTIKIQNIYNNIAKNFFKYLDLLKHEIYFFWIFDSFL